MGVVFPKPSENSTISTMKERNATFTEGSVFPVRVSNAGFSPAELFLYQGQSILFEWNDSTCQGFRIVQVCGTELNCVPGGYNSGDLATDGSFKVYFRRKGQFTFISEYVDHNLLVLPFKVKVVEKPMNIVKITDKGFEQILVNIEEGETVHWSCKYGDSEALSCVIQEMEYCFKHAGFVPKKSRIDVHSTHEMTFEDTGLYYFYLHKHDTGKDWLDDAANLICVVRVTQFNREFSIHPSDEGLNLNVISARVHDRIWLDCPTNRTFGRKILDACIYKDTRASPLVTAKLCAGLSRIAELVSYQFVEPGLYYYVYNMADLSQFRGFAVVQPKLEEHVIDIVDGHFRPALLTLNEKERVWWTWNDDYQHSSFILKELNCCSPLTRRKSLCSGCDCKKLSNQVDVLRLLGMVTHRFDSIGEFSYHLVPEDKQSFPSTCCSVVVQTNAKYHSVKVCDGYFIPKILNVHPGDWVWWQWGGTKRPHNIKQVSHQWISMINGFDSGKASKSATAFTHLFQDLGIFYFASNGNPEMLGAVVVTPSSKVHIAVVTSEGIQPNPLAVSVNDCVTWVWSNGTCCNVQEMSLVGEVQGSVKPSHKVHFKRCHSRLFGKAGMYLFLCSGCHDSESEVPSQRNESLIHSVLVEPVPYSHRVGVSAAEGFKPSVLTIEKSQCILWTWENQGDEEHNIIHVRPPQAREFSSSSDDVITSRPFPGGVCISFQTKEEKIAYLCQPLSRVVGLSAFNSGQRTTCSTFFHTFDVSGTYFISSEGTDGHFCKVEVLEKAVHVAPPGIPAGGKDGGDVECGYQVFLECETEEAGIYYTKDGSYPAEYNSQLMHYNKKKGIYLAQAGFAAIRAVAKKEGCVTSSVYTSKCFWVIASDDVVHEDLIEKESEEKLGTESEEVDLKEEIFKWHWFSCRPSITVELVCDNTFNINITLGNAADLSWIKGFQLFLNGRHYGGLFGPRCRGLVVSGMRGGKVYHVVMVAYPTQDSFEPQLSNKVVVSCPLRASSGGPVVSLEATASPQSLVIVWPICCGPNTADIVSYSVIINDQPFGEQVIPESESGYCRILFESSLPDQSYSLRVVSYSFGGSDILLYSNEVEFSLPISEEILAGAVQKTTAESDSGEGNKNHDGEAARELLFVAERVTSELCESEQSAEGEELSLRSVISKLQPIPEDQQLDVLAAEPDADVEQGVSSEEMDDLKTMLVDNELLHCLEEQGKSAEDGLVISGYEETDVKDAPADLSSPQGGVETCTAFNVELDPTLFRDLYVSYRRTDSIVRSLVDSTEDARKASQLHEEVMDKATTGQESDDESSTPAHIVYNELQDDVIVNQCVVHDHGPTIENASEQDVGTQKTLENREGKRTQLMDNEEQSSLDETSANFWDHNEEQSDEDMIKNEKFIVKRDKLKSHATSLVASQGSTDHNRAGDDGVQVSWDNEKSEVESRKDPDRETVEDGSHFNDLGHDTFISHSLRNAVEETDSCTSDGMSYEMADDCTEKVVSGLPKHDTSDEIEELQDSDTEIEEGHMRGARDECLRKVIIPDERAQLILECDKLEQPVNNRELNVGRHQGEIDDLKLTRIQLENTRHEEVNGKRRNENLQEELIAAAVEVLQDSLINFTQVEHRAISVSKEKDVFEGAINQRLKEGTHSEKVLCIENQSADLTRQEMNCETLGPKNAGDGNRPEVVDDTWSAFSSNGSVRINNDRIMTVASETTEMHTFEESSVFGDPMFALNSNHEDANFRLERENRESNTKEEEAEDRFQEVWDTSHDENSPGEFKHLPRPLLVIKGTTPTTVTLEWEWTLLPGQIAGADIVYSVFALGRKFHSDINSSFCFNFEDSPLKTMWPKENAHFKQHAWRTTGSVIEITGLKQRCSYRMAVLGQLMPCADESLSRVISFTMPGPPKSPLLNVRDLQDRQVTLTWKPPASFGDATVVGYRLLKDGKAFGEDLSSETFSLSLTGLEEGVIHNFSLLALTGHSVGDSKSSNAIVVHCPTAPVSPHIYIVESSTWGSICIAWKRDKPVSSSYSKRPVQSSYCVFVDGVLHGECALDQVTDIFSDEHTYTITDCICGRKYSLSVRKYLNPDVGTSEDRSKVCVCGCYGESSNILEVYCAGPPSPPVPRVSHIDQSGVTLSWSRSREYGGVALAGYLLRVNGKWSGELFPPEQQETKLTGFKSGDVIRVQMAAITSDLDVPISETLSQEVNKPRSLPSSVELLDSGVESSSSLLSKGSVDHSIQLSRSLGTPLLIQYSNLVRPISRFELTNVCCRSVSITWSLDVTASCSVEPAILSALCWKTTEHRRSAVRHRVEEKPFRIKDLEPGMEYYVMLECFASHVNDDISNELPINRNQSQPISFKTGIPPGPLTNIYVISATEQSIKLAWEAPVEHGVPAAMILVNVKKTSQHSTEQGVNFHMSPDSTAFEFEHLASRTLYAFTLKVLTEDDIVDISEERSNSIASFCASTNGVDPADKLTPTSRTPTSLSIKWQPAVAYGLSTIQHYKVHYDLNRRQRKTSRSKVAQKADSAKDFLIESERCEAALRGLEPGCVYKIIVQTVEGVMDYLYKEDFDSDDSDTNSSYSSAPSEKPADVQRIHLSGPLLVSTSAPPESPVLMVSDFTATQIRLTWNRPLVLSPVTDDDDIPRGRVRHLKGFRVQINGRVFSRLTADKTSIILKKCKSGMKYTCVVVAMTCPEIFSGQQRKQSEPPDSTISETDTDEDDIKSSSDCFQESASDPVEVTLPRQDWGVCLRADYCASKPASSLGSSPCSETGDEDGGVIVQWKLLSDLAVYTSGFRVIWYCSTLDDWMEVSLTGDANEYGIWSVSPSAVYTIYLEVLNETKEAKAVFGPVHCQTPGPPASPWIWCRTLSQSQITIEWNEPVTYGDVSIRGYQVYLNNRRLEKLVDRTQRRVTIHCQSSCVYRVSLVALGSDPQYSDSPPSNVLKLCTPAAQFSSMGHRPSVGVKRPSPDFTVNVLGTSDTSISFEWTHPPEIYTADHYVIKWSSVVQPQIQELTLPLIQTGHLIEGCSPGSNHFLVVAAVNAAGGLVSRSEQYLVQTSAPVQQPVIKLRFCHQTSITIEWSKPTTFGDAEIDHYKLMVNRKSEAQLDVEFSEYKFNTCEPCQEYTFVLKAISTKPTCDSRWSEPLVVTCPGSEKPHITRIQSHQVNRISLGWKPPLLKGGAEVFCYKVYYLEDTGELMTSGGFITNEKTIKHGPLPSQTEKDELFPVSPDCYYWVMLQLELLPDDCLAVCSEPIRTRAAVSPDSPLISLEVECLDERRRLEERICELTYKRDRLQKIVSSLENSIVVKGSKEKDSKIVEATNSILQVHSELSDALEDIKEYTGSISTLIRWSRPCDDGDAVVSGYQVFVDGARHGKILSQSSLETCLQLSSDCHVIAVQTLTDHPVGPSPLSNPVEVSGCEFLPFVLFCYFDVHKRSESCPRHGCCSWEDSHSWEFKHTSLSSGEVFSPQGILARRIPCPVLSVMDVFSALRRPIAPVGLNKMVALLFWTKWCFSSQKVMEYFVQFAEEFVDEFSFVTCCVRSEEPLTSHRQALADILTERDWRKSTDSVTHTCGCHPQSQRTRHARRGVMSNPDVCQLFGLVGTPTLILLNSSSYISWQGRCSCQDASSFRLFLRHIFSQVGQTLCPVSKCRHCELEKEDEQETSSLDEEENAENISSKQRRESSELKFLQQRLHGTKSDDALTEKPLTSLRCKKERARQKATTAVGRSAKSSGYNRLSGFVEPHRSYPRSFSARRFIHSSQSPKSLFGTPQISNQSSPGRFALPGISRQRTIRTHPHKRGSTPKVETKISVDDFNLG